MYCQVSLAFYMSASSVAMLYMSLASKKAVIVMLLIYHLFIWLIQIAKELKTIKKYPFRNGVTGIDAVDLVFIMCWITESQKTSFSYYAAQVSSYVLDYINLIKFSFIYLNWQSFPWAK